MKCVILMLACLLSLKTYAQVDTSIGLNISKKQAKNISTLAHALCDNYETDREKVNAIYNWVTHNIEFDVSVVKSLNLKEVSAEKVLRRKKAVCIGYAKLVVELCEAVKIPAVVIDGYSKDWMFDDGDEFYIPRHAWNAVYIDLQWQLIDATWGAGHVGQYPSGVNKLVHKASDKINYSGKLRFKYDYDTTYFLQNPLTFRVKHLPSDPVWQLTDTTMPLQVFEAGADSILAFNKAFPELHNTDMALNEIGRMGEMEKMISVAERSYSYNPRYKLVMATMEIAQLADTINEVKTSQAPVDDKEIKKVVTNSVKESGEYVKEQKMSISSQYSSLTRKNKTKHLAATRYISRVQNSNTRLIARCEASRRKASTRISREQTKRHQTITASGVAKKGKSSKKSLGPIDPSNPQLLAIYDSITQQLARIEGISADDTFFKAAIVGAKSRQDQLFDSMVNCIVLADSALVQETIARVNMHDNLDKEVIYWNTIVQDVRLTRLDSLQMCYLAGFDSVFAANDAYLNTKKQQLDLCKKAMKGIAQYEKKNSTNPEMHSLAAVVKAQSDTLRNTYIAAIDKNAVYYIQHQKLMDKLIELYKHEDKLADYMLKAEDKRNDEEEKYIVKWKTHDLRENEKQTADLEHIQRQAEKLLSSK